MIDIVTDIPQAKAKMGCKEIPAGTVFLGKINGYSSLFFKLVTNDTIDSDEGHKIWEFKDLEPSEYWTHLAEVVDYQPVDIEIKVTRIL